LLVTIPPLQISKSVATHVSHANRFNHFIDPRTNDDTTEGRGETNKRELNPKKLGPEQLLKFDRKILQPRTKAFRNNR
jgi:hypothetical protein